MEHGGRNCEGSSPETMINHSSLSSFPQFQSFSAEIRRLVLSFVADGPMEHKEPEALVHAYRPGSLTSTIPLVNREFHLLSNHDDFWEPILKRQIVNKVNGMLWIEGLRRLLPLEHEFSVAHVVGRGPSPEEIIQAVCAHLNRPLNYKQLYIKVFTTHVRFDAPVFVMPCHLRIGEAYGLHLFEPRYRIMIRDLMNETQNPQTASSGGEILYGVRDGLVKPPLLIHANLGTRLAPGECACLVQVIQCHTYEYGTADVRLLPVAWCRLDRIWVRPNAGRLFYAKAMRLPSEKEYYNSV
jgi:hypothetical protein